MPDAILPALAWQIVLASVVPEPLVYFLESHSVSRVAHECAVEERRVRLISLLGFWRYVCDVAAVHAVAFALVVTGSERFTAAKIMTGQRCGCGG